GDRGRRHPRVGLGHNRHRRPARDRGRSARGHQHIRRLPREPADAGDVQKEGEEGLTANQVALSYLLASVLFILSLRGLSHPLSARRGNLFGMIGMALAILTTLAVSRRIDLAIGALAAGAVIGIIVSRRLQMTQMPELVAA